VLTGRFIHTWDFTVRPLAQMRYEAFSAVVNGVAVCVDDELTDHIGTIREELTCVPIPTNRF